MNFEIPNQRNINLEEVEKNIQTENSSEFRYTKNKLSSLEDNESDSLGDVLRSRLVFMPAKQDIETVNVVTDSEEDSFSKEELEESRMENKFNIESHAQLLYDKVIAILNYPGINIILSKFNSEDYYQLLSNLSSQVNHPSKGELASFLLFVSNNKKDEFKNNEQHSTSQIKELSTDFIEEIDKLVRENFNALEVLGIKELSFDLGSERGIELTSYINRQFGSGPIQNFVRFIIKQSLEDVKKEIGKKKKNEEEAKPGEVLNLSNEASPQEWLDSEREKHFEDLMDIFEKIQEERGDTGIREWFRNVFNPALKYEGMKEIDLDDIKSLNIAFINSESASQIAKQTITRPVLLFSDIGEYQNFIKNFTSTASRGCNFPGSLFQENGPLCKTGLLISTNSKEYISHEIKHSIDPNLEKREGIDRVLEELFAHYHSSVVEVDLETFSHLKNPTDGPWNSLLKTLTDELYINNYIEDYGEESIKNNIVEQINDLIFKIRNFSNNNGHIETQRVIAESKTIKELLSVIK